MVRDAHWSAVEPLWMVLVWGPLPCLLRATADLVRVTAEEVAEAYGNPYFAVLKEHVGEWEDFQRQIAGPAGP